MSESFKKCSKCKEEINKSASKCKHCGADQRNWVMRHKILSLLVVFFIIAIVANANQPSNSTVSASKISKENCDLIKSGMSVDDVKNVLGEPKTQSESEIGGQKSEYLHFQDGFKLEACAVTISNGKVFSKSWTKL